jgi:hypothetical protein
MLLPDARGGSQEFIFDGDLLITTGWRAGSYNIVNPAPLEDMLSPDRLLRAYATGANAGHFFADMLLAMC